MSQYAWLLIVSMGLVTFALRLSFLMLNGRLVFPPLVQRALRYVPYAVLAALVVPALFGGREVDFAVQPTRLIAALVGAAIAWRSGSVLLTLTLGMVTLWLGKFLV
ncbi:MAG: AzlD domain-containing protein [Trueperaceae bacterium]